MKKYTNWTVMLAALILALGCLPAAAQDNSEAVPTSDRVAAIREQGVLRVGSTGDYKPMAFLEPETGEYWGFDVELAQDIADALGVRIEFVPTTWPTLMEDTLAGRFDLAVCGISPTRAARPRSCRKGISATARPSSAARRTPAGTPAWKRSTARRSASWKTPAG